MSVTVERDGARSRGRELPRRLSPGELAWVALLPWSLLTAAALLVLGPPLGRALFPPDHTSLWPPTWWNTEGRPEPTEYGRYALAVLAPVALAALIAMGAQRAPALRPRTTRALAAAGQAGAAGLFIVAMLGQRNVIDVGWPQLPIPTDGALQWAVTLTLLPLLVLRHPRIRGFAARLAVETTPRRVLGLVLAVCCMALFLLEGVTTDGLAEDNGQLNWALNDAFAVLNGRTPLVDYHVLYAKLLPYPTALALATFGTTGLVFSLTMVLLSAGALIAVYATFRLVVRSSLLALLLFVPFVAASDFGRTFTRPAMWPMRYGGAYVLAGLLARHVAGRRPRHTWPLFLVGGVVAIDNQDFGIAALGATVAALVCAKPQRSAAAVRRLGLNLLGGVGGAIVVVSALTVVRSGALPNPALVSEWSEIFTRLGWFSLPMPIVGFHLAVYATFAAAVVTAGVRLARQEDDTLLTTLLAWAGTFGLLAGVYYVGRSDDLKLLGMMSAWSFALALLLVATARALTARGWRAPRLAELMVLFGFGLAAWTITRLSLPSAQVTRLTSATPPLTYRASAEQFVSDRTRPHETVAILFPLSFRVAYELRLRNVAPYVMQNAIITRSQLQTLIDTLRQERVRSVFVPEDGEGRVAGEAQTPPEHLSVLAAAGYRIADRESGFVWLKRSGVRG
jgi:hypothetical protein